LWARHYPSFFLAAGLCMVAVGLGGSAGRAMTDTEHSVAAQVGVLIDVDALALTASINGIEHLERPDYLDQLALVRSGGQGLVRAVFTLTRTTSLAISMLAALWLLAAVHPFLVVMPIAAIPLALVLPRSQRPIERAALKGAELERAANQLHRLFLTPGPAMELRLCGAAPRIDARADELWRTMSDVQVRGALRSAAIGAVGWLALTGGYAASMVFTVRLCVSGRATVGDVMLVSQLALVVRTNVESAAEAVRQASAALRTADRYLWLEHLRRVDRARYPGTEPLPNGLTSGIRFDRVGFNYPGTDRRVLHEFTLNLPAGSTIAIVGDNGAGKTTLVKLLTGMYQPSCGRIFVDGKPLPSFNITDWRRRTTATFQDFARLETTAERSVGFGDPVNPNQRTRVEDALEQVGAQAVINMLPKGLDSHLGTTYKDGSELSGGQWQRLAVARSAMPQAPLCLIFDEPTAALDPEAEQRIFQLYRQTARNLAAPGAITVLVSHRFSSVAIADLIAVLTDGTVSELGTHAELMAQNGTYAAMYRKQAEAYS
jgi:ATP-binding cassette, subfamily B, bacterial